MDTVTYCFETAAEFDAPVADLNAPIIAEPEPQEAL
jgi:hypothetical protein